MEIRNGGVRRRTDRLAAEEPLEIRVWPAGAERAVPVAVTMRTPGSDFELAAGFLFTEGILRSRDEVGSIRYCTDEQVDGPQQYNIVNVMLRPGVAFDPVALTRHFYASSSCGICGKASIEAVQSRCAMPVPPDGPAITAETVAALADRLRAAQPLFDQTGGLHAAALFDPAGRLLAVREDVGRHNAVDKLVGQALMAGQLPLVNAILMVSGRISFELVQKAAAAGIPVLVAVSAPSSLACAAAEAWGLTLIGFARGDRFNVYTGAHRVQVSDGR